MVLERADWTEHEVDRARELWAQYQHDHDLSDRLGETVGIDPRTGAIWFGESILDIADQQQASGRSRPLLFFRVGSTAYFRKLGMCA